MPVPGSAAEVFRVFLKLGLTSFGGPIAHLGFFRNELVVRRRWLSEAAYADLVALCQFLPGPASSQVGFALGLTRAGWVGAIAAFCAFTLPSAVLLTALALLAAGGRVPSGLLHGLEIVAVAIVAQAVLGMARALCPDAPRATIAVGAVIIMVVWPGTGGMMAAIGAGAVTGLLLRGPQPVVEAHPPIPLGRGAGMAALLAFGLLFFALPLLAKVSHDLAVASGFFRAGALVFGGGHVVLPLLEAETVATGWVTAQDFSAGYALAQAVPGPLFTFAAWLGAVDGEGAGGITTAVVALLAIFLPGFLLLIGVLPFWNGLRTRPGTLRLMQGANAAVVGILGLALYDPLFVGGIRDRGDFAMVAMAFIALTAWRAPPWMVVLGGAVAGVATR
ncbi:chromate efflux transporter [Falsirhodobacter halotolerans]|uniref:chromate efflux transporter n=1 Tax=Falsirhodobacter halotolerans TaxID=1146892 RepID=UPI001FD51D7D|nr:chromate efflux transporter [Falsirhodobacter halotolerans]MCJ8139966.1 chromate efflux transporter [Falsirhodobacter halotolerans]